MLSQHSRSPRWYLSIPSELELTEVDPRQGLRRQLGCDPKKTFCLKENFEIVSFFSSFQKFPSDVGKELFGKQASLIVALSFIQQDFNEAQWSVL